MLTPELTPEQLSRRYIEKKQQEIASQIRNIEKSNPGANPIWVRELAHYGAMCEREWKFQSQYLEGPAIDRWRLWKNHLRLLIRHMATGAELPWWFRNPNRARHTALDWPTHMLHAAATDPERALDILENTTYGCRIPGYMLADIVNFLTHWSRQFSGQQLVTYSRRLARMAVAIFHRAYDGRVRLQQHTIYNLTGYLNTKGVTVLYRVLRENDNPLARPTVLKLASLLAREPRYKGMAMEITMQAIEDGSADLEDPYWQGLFTSILTLESDQANIDTNFVVADAFVRLLEHGFTPNLVTFTATIKSLTVVGQHDTARRICDILRHQNIKPDDKLFGTILHLARKSRSTTAAIEVTDEAVRQKNVDEVFLNELLFSIFDSARAESVEKKRAGDEVTSLPSFGPMLVYYARVFNLAPLQALIPLDLKLVLEMHPHPVMPGSWHTSARLFPALEMATSSFSEKRDPTAATLSIMFLAYVKTLSRPVRIISLYSYIRQRIIAGDPIATRHVEEKGSFLYDVILKALLAHPGMQRPALDIVGDMLKSATKASNVSPQPQQSIPQEQRQEEEENAMPEADGEALVTGPHPPPSVYTWTILLGGMLFYGEKESARRIEAMMREYGIVPTDVTWNTLITGYAGLQNVNGTVRALEGLEKAGYKPDVYTLRGFNRLVNKEKALFKLEERINLPKMNNKAAWAFGDDTPLQTSLGRWESFAEKRYRSEQLKSDAEEEMMQALYG